MYWHIDMDIVSLIVIAIVYICNRKLPLPERGEEDVVRNKRFTRCLEIGLGIAAIDIASSVIMEVSGPPFVYHLLMTLYFVAIELVIVEWFLYVMTILYQSNERGRKTVTHIVLLIYVLYAAFCCLNPWTGMIYSIGPNNEYSRGPMFGLMIVLYALYTITLFILILVRWKHIPKEFPGGVLLMTPVIIAVAIFVQLSVPGWLFIVASYMICLVMAFLFLQRMRERKSEQLVNDLLQVAETDKLTGLYNRVGMEAMVQLTLDEHMGLGVIVLIADIDDLKTINDTMGHAEGDRSIRLVGERLRRHFRSDDTVVRYGGDEFLAFFTGNFDEEKISGSLLRLVDELGELRIGKNDDVALHGSIGAAFGIVGQDTFETLCSRADTALYHVKRNGKNGYALYRPEMENR